MEYNPETHDDKHSERWRHENLIITESPIDAISAATLFQARGTYASTAGLRGDIPTNIRNAAYGNIIIAYDSDGAGQTAAKKLKKAYLDLGHKQVEIVKPTAGCKDWNEVLCNTASYPRRLSSGIYLRPYRRSRTVPVGSRIHSIAKAKTQFWRVSLVVLVVLRIAN